MQHSTAQHMPNCSNKKKNTVALFFLGNISYCEMLEIGCFLFCFFAPAQISVALCWLGLNCSMWVQCWIGTIVWLVSLSRTFIHKSQVFQVIFPTSYSLYSTDLLSIDLLFDLHVKAETQIYCFPMLTYSNCWRLEVFLIPVTSLYLGISQDERLQVFHPQGFSLWLPDRQQAVLTLTGCSIDTEVDLTE